MNTGKKFEQDFQNSVPKEWLCYRLRDGTASWGDSDKTRFQATNICDFIIYDGYTLHFVELKSHKGKSLPLSCIRESQLKGLNEVSKHINTFSWIIVRFDDLDETYAIRSVLLNGYETLFRRKSVPVTFFAEFGTKIESFKKISRYTYNLRSFIN